MGRCGFRLKAVGAAGGKRRPALRSQEGAQILGISGAQSALCFWSLLQREAKILGISRRPKRAGANSGSTGYPHVGQQFCPVGSTSTAVFLNPLETYSCNLSASRRPFLPSLVSRHRVSLSFAFCPEQGGQITSAFLESCVVYPTIALRRATPPLVGESLCDQNSCTNSLKPLRPTSSRDLHRWNLRWPIKLASRLTESSSQSSTRNSSPGPATRCVR